MLLFYLSLLWTRKLVPVKYLDLPVGTVLRMRSKMGNTIVVRTLEPRHADPLVGNRFHPIFGNVQYVEVLEAPHPYDGPVIMLVGRLPEGEQAEFDLDILDARTDELAPGATVLLGARQLIVDNVQVA